MDDDVAAGQGAAHGGVPEVGSGVRQLRMRRQRAPGRQASSTAMRTAASAAPTAAGTPEAVKRKGRQAMRNQSSTELGPMRKPPHDASDLENVPMRRSG